ncbi:hypothetical protein [Paraglaciecola sp.]|uniref:hypothetical protein n=1 Tax=Paraglaciecola sp. TaxID=1920173 RepID=UPI003EF49712
MYESWNEEGMLAYIREFRKTVKPLIGGKWAILSIFEEWELGHPDMDKHVIKHCEWFIKNGCVRDCHIYSSGVLKSVQLEKTAPIQKGDYLRQVFPDMPEALAWLEAEGFPIDSKSI